MQQQCDQDYTIQPILFVKRFIRVCTISSNLVLANNFQLYNLTILTIILFVKIIAFTGIFNKVLHHLRELTLDQYAEFRRYK